MTKRHPPVPVGLTVLTASDVDRVLDQLDPLTALEAQAVVFRAFSNKAPSTSTVGSGSGSGSSPSPAEIQTPQRITLSTPDQTMLFMPSRAAQAGGTAIKIVSVPSHAGEGGLPATTLVIDEVTGRVKGVVNARKLTALRNACGSALSYRALYPEGAPASLLLFGTGAQCDAHARLFVRLYPSIKRVTFIGRRPTPRSASLLISLTHTYPAVTFDFGIAAPPSSGFSTTVPSHSPASPNADLAIDLPAAAGAADIIVTATSSTVPLFRGTDAKRGSHVILIGSYKPHMHEVDGELLRRAGSGKEGAVLVDAREACAQEAGELIAAGVQESGMAELGEILGDSARAKEVRGKGELTVFKSVGIGIQDVAIASLVLREAEGLGLGTTVPDYDIAS